MAKYIGTILTKKGKDLLVRATLGEVITFTKVEIGKGIIPEGTIKEDLVSLIETFKTLSITSTTVLEAGNYRVRAAFNNSGISEDTYLREIGLFARGEDGIEVLYSYCDTATPDLIPRESSGILERVEDIITYISSAGTVNAVIDQSNVYVTIKDLTEGLLTKENKFTKKSGFNLVISHVVDSASKILVASALAVKTAYDKGLEALGLANTNKNAIQNNTEQIENLSYKEELVLIADFHVGDSHTFPLTKFDDYTEILVTGTGTGVGEGFSARRDISIFKQNLPNFKINIMDNDEPHYGNFARITTDGVDVTSLDITGVTLYKIYGIKKTIG